MFLGDYTVYSIHFGRVVVWYGVNRMIIHFFKASIPPSSLSSIHPFLQNHPGGKHLVRQGVPKAAATTFAFSSVFILLLLFLLSPTGPGHAGHLLQREQKVYFAQPGFCQCQMLGRQPGPNGHACQVTTHRLV